MYASIIALATAVSSVAALPQAIVPPANTTTATNGTAIYTCGTQPYYQSNYTCYDNQYLCPVINGLRTLACADACYDPAFYTCFNGVLLQVPGAANGTAANGTYSNTTLSK